MAAVRVTIWRAPDGTFVRVTAPITAKYRTHSFKYLSDLPSHFVVALCYCAQRVASDECIQSRLHANYMVNLQQKN